MQRTNSGRIGSQGLDIKIFGKDSERPPTLDAPAYTPLRSPSWDRTGSAGSGEEQNQNVPKGDFLTVLFLTGGSDEQLLKNMEILESEEVKSLRREVGNLASTVVSRAFRKTIDREKLRRQEYEKEQERIEDVAHKSVLRMGSNEIMMGATLLAAASAANLRSLGDRVHRGSVSSRRLRTADRKKSAAGGGLQQRSQASALVDAAAQGNAKVLAELLRDRRRPQDMLSRASKGSHRLLITPSTRSSPGPVPPRRLSLEESVDLMRQENLNLPDITGKTPLQAAFDRQSWPCVRLLLAESEVDPSICDGDGNQPLHSFLAAPGIHKQRDILRTLLRHSLVSVNARNRVGVTPLMVAVANTNLAEAEAAQQPPIGRESLDMAEEPTRKEDMVRGDELERRGSVKALSARGTSRDKGSESVARLRGRVEDGGAELKGIAQVLLEAGARVEETDEAGRLALDHAAAAGAEEPLRLLAGRQEAGEAELDRALQSVVGKGGSGSVECMKFLVEEAGARVLQGEESVVTAAARHDQQRCLAELLRTQPRQALAHRDASGASCLHAAVGQGNNECARQILQALVDNRPKDSRLARPRRKECRPSSGPSLLHEVADEQLLLMAAEANNVEMLVHLLQLCPHMRNILIPGGPGVRTSLLSWGIRTHALAVVRTLMELDADVNLPDEGGEELSPLMIAVQCLSQSTWAGLAMESLEKGQDEPYISLRDAVKVLQMTKPEVCSLAEALKDLRGNPLRSPTGRQLFNRSPWRFSWHGFMAVCSAASPDLGKQIAAYSAELEDYMQIFELIMRSGKAEINQVCGGRTAAAVAAAGANWKVFEDLRLAGARLGHCSVALATARNNHAQQLGQCLQSVQDSDEAEVEASGLTEAVCKEIFDVTCAAGHVHCATLLYEFAQTRAGWCMVMNEQLMDAVEKQHYWMIDFLVTKGQSEQTKGHALLRSTEHGDFRSAQKLLHAGTNPDFSQGGRCALTIAGARWGCSGSVGHYEILVSLLRRGADAGKRDGDGMTVLMWAAARGHEKLMRLALSAAERDPAAVQALVDAQDASGRTALMYAAMSLDPQTVLLLLEYKANPDVVCKPGPNNSQPPMTALSIVTSQCSLTWPPFLNDLVRETRELSLPDAKGDTFVVWAARWGHTEGMRVAIEGRAQKRLGLEVEREPSALELAVMCRHEEIVRLLLSCWERSKPSPDACRDGPYVGLSLLTRAIEYDWEEVVEVLVDRFPGLDPEKQAVRSALHSCIERRWLRGLRGLLGRGVRPNAVLVDEPPPLLEACKLDEPRQVQALLKKGASGIEPAVVVALFLGHLDCFRHLWHQVPKSSDLLRAAACMAALTNRFDALKTIMLAAKDDADIHIYGRKVVAIMSAWLAPAVMHRLSPLLYQLVETDDPSAPLLCAVSKGHFRCSSYLLECKADPLVTDENNLSPIQWACAVGNLDIVKVLVKYGAPVCLEEGQRSLSFADIRMAYQLDAKQKARRYLSRGALLRSANDMAHKIQLSVSPLLAALVRGHRDVARLLLEAGADPGELKGWCQAAVAADSRLEPLVMGMLATILDLEDFKAYGPFGIAGPEVNRIDAKQIPVSGRLRSVMVQFSESDWALVAIQFIHEVKGKLYECTVHKTTAPHAGEFQGCDRFKHLERLDLEEKEYIIQVEVAINDECVAGLRFTTNHRVCKWLGEEATAGSNHRLVTLAPQGREIVGLFSAVYDRFYLVGFITRLRMGDVPWRSFQASARK